MIMELGRIFADSALFCVMPIKADLGRFKTLSPENGTTYRFAGNMALKRKFARNNFFAKKSQKL